MSKHTAAISGGETVTNLNPERHIVVSYTPGTDNLRVMPNDDEHHSGDAKALREAADLLAPARRGAAVSVHTADIDAGSSARVGQHILEIQWARETPDSPNPPTLVGPFKSRDEAHVWAGLNVSSGSWEARPIQRPTSPQFKRRLARTRVTPPGEGQP